MKQLCHVVDRIFLVQGGTGGGSCGSVQQPGAIILCMAVLVACVDVLQKHVVCVHLIELCRLFQMGLVMEDRSRLEHLMGIAQNLRLKSSGSGSHSVSSTDRPSFDKPARLPLQPDTKAGGSIGFGGGILSALNFSKDAVSQDALPEATSSIPSVLGEQAEVEKKMQSMQVTAAPEEPIVSGPETVTVENVPKVCPLSESPQ